VSSAVYTAEEWRGGAGRRWKLCPRPAPTIFTAAGFYSLRKTMLWDAALRRLTAPAFRPLRLHQFWCEPRWAPIKKKQSILLHELLRGSCRQDLGITPGSASVPQRCLSRHGDRDIAYTEAADGCLSCRTRLTLTLRLIRSTWLPTTRCVKIPVMIRFDYQFNDGQYVSTRATNNRQRLYR